MGGVVDDARRRGGPPGPGLSGRRRARVPPTPASSVDVAGGLAKDQIRRVIRRNRAQVRHCYEQGLRLRPDLQGRIAVRFVVDPSGRVSAVSAVANELTPEVGACVLGKVRGWSFPAAPGITAVTYPFRFDAL